MRSRPWLFLLVLTSLVSCGAPSGVGGTDGTPASNIALAREFELRPGESALVDGTNLRLTFVGVVEDSRCPIDAICVWAGNARIRLHAGGSAEADLELDSMGDTERFKRSADFEGYRVHLVTLTNPNRASSEHPPRPSEYVATLRVEKP